MSKQVILLDQYTISFMEATIYHGRVRVSSFVRLPRSQFNQGSQSTPKQVGEALHDELTRLGWNPNSAVLILSAPLVIERSISLPKTSPAALPSIVQLQVEAMPLLSMVDPVVDYSVQPSQGSRTFVDVTISSAAAINDNVRMLEESGFAISSVTSCLHALIASIDHVLKFDKNEFDLIVLASNRSIEVIALEEAHVLSTHRESIVAADTEIGDLLRSIIGRCIKGIQRRYESYQPKTALLLLDDPDWGSKIAGFLHQEFEIEATTEDYRDFFSCKHAAVDKQPDLLQAESVLLAGALSAQTQPSQRRVNLLQPKRVKKRLFFKGAVALIAASMLALLGNQGIRYLEGERLIVETKWSELRRQVDELDAENKKSERLLRMAEVVQEWKGHSVPWLPELVALADNLPDENDAYIRQLDLRSDQDSDLPLANAVGFAKKQADVMEMNQRLSAATSRYEMEPRPFYLSERNAPFVHQFELNLRLHRDSPLQTNTDEESKVSEQKEIEGEMLEEESSPAFEET